MQARTVMPPYSSIALCKIIRRKQVGKAIARVINERQNNNKKSTEIMRTMPVTVDLPTGHVALQRTIGKGNSPTAKGRVKRLKSQRSTPQLPVQEKTTFCVTSAVALQCCQTGNLANHARLVRWNHVL